MTGWPAQLFIWCLALSFELVCVGAWVLVVSVLEAFKSQYGGGTGFPSVTMTLRAAAPFLPMIPLPWLAWVVRLSVSRRVTLSDAFAFQGTLVLAASVLLFWVGLGLLLAWLGTHLLLCGNPSECNLVMG